MWITWWKNNKLKSIHNHIQTSANISVRPRSRVFVASIVSNQLHYTAKRDAFIKWINHQCHSRIESVRLIALLIYAKVQSAVDTVVGSIAHICPSWLVDPTDWMFVVILIIIFHNSSCINANDCGGFACTSLVIRGWEVFEWITIRVMSCKDKQARLTNVMTC